MAAPSRRRRGVVLVAVVLVAVVAMGGLVLRSRGEAPSAMCRGLGGRVAGLDAITWDNGITQTGGSWLAALTDGVDHADAPSRQRIAVAVSSDAVGYDAMVADLDPTLRSRFDRLRDAVSHPGVPGEVREPETREALDSVRVVAATRCNLV